MAVLGTGVLVRVGSGVLIRVGEDTCIGRRVLVGGMGVGNTRMVGVSVGTELGVIVAVFVGVLVGVDTSSVMAPTVRAAAVFAFEMATSRMFSDSSAAGVGTDGSDRAIPETTHSILKPRIAATTTPIGPA